MWKMITLFCANLSRRGLCRENKSCRHGCCCVCVLPNRLCISMMQLWLEPRQLHWQAVCRSVLVTACFSDPLLPGWRQSSVTPSLVKDFSPSTEEMWRTVPHAGIRKQNRKSEKYFAVPVFLCCLWHLQLFVCLSVLFSFVDNEACVG